MRRIDELHLEAPFFGARKIAAQLRREGQPVGRRHVRTLMRKMGIQALYRRPRTSIPAREATIYPYLLENMAIERSHQVWASDLTYLPMAHGFLYLMRFWTLPAARSLPGACRIRWRRASAWKHSRKPSISSGHRRFSTPTGSSVTPSASASRVHPWWFIGRAHQLGREHGGLSEKGSSPLRSGGVGGSGHRWKPIFQRLPSAMPYGTRCEIEMCSQRGTRRCLLHIRLAGCQSPYCRENRLCRSHNRPTYLRECRSEAVLD